MKTEIVFIIEESLDGGFEAHALWNSSYTEGDTLDDLKKILENLLPAILKRRLKGRSYFELILHLNNIINLIAFLRQMTFLISYHRNKYSI